MPGSNERTVKKGGVLKWANARWWHIKLAGRRQEWVRIEATDDPNTIRVSTRAGEHICDAERMGSD